MNVHGRTVLLFAKAPRPGRVKTRLVPPLSAEAAADLARAFLADTAAFISRVRAGRKIVAYAPPDGFEEVRAVAGDAFEYLPQEGRDLGERMERAFARVFEEGAEAAVAVGADTPTLAPNLVEEAFALLEGGKDVVLGPSYDSGYYLIGLARPCPRLFRGIAWGGDEVLRATLAAVEAEELRLGVLPPRKDVDTPEDLAFLALEVHALRLAGAPGVPQATAAALDALGCRSGRDG